MILVISGDTPSLKNSKEIGYSFKKRRKVLKPSDRYIAWAQVAELELLQYRQAVKAIEWHSPITLKFKFFRSTKRGFDYLNVAQGICDVGIKMGLWPEDNMNYIIPDFSEQWGVDKLNPRMEVEMVNGRP